jgi:TonB family protein
MGLIVTTFGGRAVALGASVVAHAAVVVAAASGGHAPVRAQAAESRELTVEVVEAPVPEQVEEAPPRDAHDHDHPHASAHTHPYPVDPDHDARPHDPSIVHHPHAPPVPRASEPAPVAMPEPDLSAAPQPASEPPRFTLPIGNVSPRVTSVAPAAGGNGAGGAGGHDDVDEVFPAATVSVPARCAGSAPRYTREAEAAGIELDVPLEIVVDARGRVLDAKTLAPAGYGLDASAVAGARTMRCEPAQRAGRAVSVRMRWVTTFRLR